MQVQLVAARIHPLLETGKVRAWRLRRHFACSDKIGVALVPSLVAIVRYSELNQTERSDRLIGCEARLDPETLVEHRSKVVIDPVEA